MKVVLFCGGAGMRLRGYSDDVPKPMVTVGSRPVMWHLMKYYAHYGHKDFILCLGYKGSVIKEFLDVMNSDVAGAFYLFGSEPDLLETIEKLLGAFPGVPSRLETRQLSLDLTEIHAVASFIGTGVRRVLDPAAGHRFCHNLCYFANAVVFLRRSHVESLVMDRFPWRLQDTKKGPRDVLNVHNRTPRRAVAFDVNLPGGEGPGY